MRITSAHFHGLELFKPVKCDVQDHSPNDDSFVRSVLSALGSGNSSARRSRVFGRARESSNSRYCLLATCNATRSKDTHDSLTYHSHVASSPRYKSIHVEWTLSIARILSHPAMPTAALWVGPGPVVVQNSESEGRGLRAGGVQETQPRTECRLYAIVPLIGWWHWRFSCV